MHEALESKLTDLLSGQVVMKNYELYAMRVFNRGRRQVVSLQIDHTFGGITLDECANWNRVVGDLIDREQLIDRSYVVEVASPGLDKPMVGDRDFRRLRGRMIEYEIQDNDATFHKRFATVERVENGCVYLKPERETEVIAIPIKQIHRAKPRV